MTNRHITKILDQTAFAELSGQDRETVAAHVTDCADCRRAFEAAKLSSVLLKADAVAAETFKPSPFFQAKVMNAWREQQLLQRRPIQAFRRWWQASAAPVFMMLATMAILISLTFFAPQAADDSTEVSSFNLYPTDSVVLNQKTAPDLTNEQVFQLIYGARNGGNSRK
jgi:predicted anti-sigma-YlaC factor YlaD